MIAVVILLCAASAIVGRLLLTIDEARRTLTVRMPALALALVAGLIFGAATVVTGILFFIGGSFYGLATWWWPMFSRFWVEDFAGLLSPVLTGRWE